MRSYNYFFKLDRVLCFTRQLGALLHILFGRCKHAAMVIPEIGMECMFEDAYIRDPSG